MLCLVCTHSPSDFVHTYKQEFIIYSYTMAMRDFAELIVKSQAAMISTNIYHSHAACFIYKAYFTLIVVYYVRATITR